MSDKNRSRSSTIFEKLQDENDISLLTFKYIRPYLMKSFFHAVLLLLSILAYMKYKESSDDFYSLLNVLNERVIIDIKIIDYKPNENCQKIFKQNYTDINFAHFPLVSSGCRCNDDLYVNEKCNEFKENKFNYTELIKLKNKCVESDEKNFINYYKRYNSQKNKNINGKRYLINLYSSTYKIAIIF
jgi:hypothetical protein